MDWPAVIQPFLIEDESRPSFFKYLSGDEPPSESLVLISEEDGDTIFTDRRELTQGDPTTAIPDTGWEEWFRVRSLLPSSSPSVNRQIKDYQYLFDKRDEPKPKPGYQILCAAVLFCVTDWGGKADF